MNQNELVGERCRLRPLLPEHVTQTYVDWLNDPEVNRYLESRFEKHTLESVCNFVALQHSDENTFLYGIWIATPEHPVERHVGNIKLGPINRLHMTADMGFLIGERDCWGKGLASEAISMVVAMGFARGLKKITAGAYENNPGSAKALVKAGFIAEGLRAGQVVFDDRRVGILLFGIQCP